MKKTMKVFAPIIALTFMFDFLHSASAADAAAKDQRDGANFLAGFYAAIDAGNLDTLSEIPAITRILGGRPFNSANLKTVDSAVLVPALIDALKYNNERTKGFKAGIAGLQAMVIAKAKPDLTAPPCVGGHCPHAADFK